MATAKKPRKVRTPAEKAADFKKIAGKHAATGLAAISRLAKCARPGRYAWTPEQVRTLEKAFGEALAQAFALLKNPPQSGSGKLTHNIFD